MEFFLTVFYSSLFTFLIFKSRLFKTQSVNPVVLASIFGIKIAFGFFSLYIYSHYYTDRASADIFRYFDDSQIMFNALKENPIDYFKMLLGFDHANMELYYYEMDNWYRQGDGSILNDNRTMIRYNAILSLLSWGKYKVHIVFTSFLSLIGSTLLFKALKDFIASKNLLIIAVFLVPSVLFWTSGVFKESLVYLGLGLLTFSFTQLKTRSIFHWVLLITSVLLLLSIKLYFLIAFIPAILAFFWVQKTNGKLIFVRYLSVFIVITSLGLIAYNFFMSESVFETFVRKKIAFEEIIKIGDVGSAINALPLESNFISFCKHLPQALLNSLLAPTPWQANSSLSIINATENILVILFMILCIVFPKKLTTQQKNILWTFLFFIVPILALIGWVTPVAGAIVRYKSPLIPFILICGLMILDPQKLGAKIPFIRKFITT